MSALEIFQADLDAPDHQAAILDLIDMYAADPMGGEKPLDPTVRERLIPGLKAHPTTVIFVALVDDRPAGIAVCFWGFSTFAAQPLLNIHDFAVAPAQRGRGVAKALLTAVEAKARERGACKLTLEVLIRNARAQGVYRAHGFTAGAVDDHMLFFTKSLKT